MITARFLYPHFMTVLETKCHQTQFIWQSGTISRHGGCLKLTYDSPVITIIPVITLWLMEKLYSTSLTITQLDPFFDVLGDVQIEGWR